MKEIKISKAKKQKLIDLGKKFKNNEEIDVSYILETLKTEHFQFLLVLKSLFFRFENFEMISNALEIVFEDENIIHASVKTLDHLNLHLIEEFNQIKKINFKKANELEMKLENETFKTFFIGKTTIKMSTKNVDEEFMKMVKKLQENISLVLEIETGYLLPILLKQYQDILILFNTNSLNFSLIHSFEEFLIEISNNICGSGKKGDLENFIKSILEYYPFEKITRDTNLKYVLDEKNKMVKTNWKNMIFGSIYKDLRFFCKEKNLNYEEVLEHLNNHFKSNDSNFKFKGKFFFFF